MKTFLIKVEFKEDVTKDFEVSGSENNIFGVDKEWWGEVKSFKEIKNARDKRKK